MVDACYQPRIASKTISDKLDTHEAIVNEQGWMAHCPCDPC